MNTPRYHVLIIGAGRIGKAFAHLIRATRQATVALWDTNPDLVPGQTLLSASAPSADLVFFAVPTPAIRSALTEVSLLIHPQATCLFFSKGLEAETKLTAAEIVEATLGTKKPWVVIGGPMIAEEIKAGARGHAVLAGPGIAVRRTLETVMPPESMSFSESTRPRDVSLAGVLKNVYAMAYGVGVGLGWSPIALSDLWKRCETELITAADRCGIEREVIIGPAGLEDFHTTGGSPHSRNRNAGVQLATSGTFDETAEAINTLPLLLERFPALASLDCIHSLTSIFAHANPRTAYDSIAQSLHH